jgi:lipopolysaccharide biosynthesis regulator YciM
MIELATAGGVQGPVSAPGAEAAPGTADGGWFDWLWALAGRPGFVETLLAVTVLAAAVLLWLRLARIVERVRNRAALADYLLGVEQALHGDLPGAEQRLQRVLLEDPENHYCRLLLGKVLAERGEPAEAHKHHLFLQRAFAVDSVENDHALARCLLAVGRPAEAGDAAERALRKAPDRRELQEFLFRARLAAKDHAAAASAGQKLLAMAPAGAATERLRADIAASLTAAGFSALAAGQVGAARAHAQLAARTLPGDGAESASVRLLQARIEAAEQGTEAVARALLARAAPGSGDASASVPIVAPAGALTVMAPSSGALPRALAALIPASRFACTACGAPHASALRQCPRCGSADAVVPLEPALFAAVQAPDQMFDAIEANAAHVRRIVRLALDLEAPTQVGAARIGMDAARAEVLELREAAVEELLAVAWQRGAEPAERAIALLRAMGPAITPSLFAASEALEKKRILPLGRSPMALVGRVVQGFDRAALPHVGELFATAKTDQRRVLIDYFLGLADLAEFEIVLERFPPLEILHRLNKADADVLQRFLQAVPKGHFVAEGLLLDPAFYREEEVLQAIRGAQHPDALEQVLVRRGPTGPLERSLIRALADEALRPVARRVLLAHGEPALDHLLAAFTDQECDRAQREQLAALLPAFRALAVEPLCASFGPEASALDDEVHAVLVAMGDDAVAPLQSAYGKSGFLERWSAGLLPRHTNRRAQIVRALLGIGSAAAAAALRALRESERDANLKLRLDQALHRLAGAAVEDAHGQTG